MMSFIASKFHAILLRCFSGVVLTNCFSNTFHFRQISKFKKSVIQRKKWNQNFLWICTSTHYVLHYYKVSGNSVERFQRSCTNKKNSSIFHFGKISKFKKDVSPRKKMESKFHVEMHMYTLCPS